MKLLGFDIDRIDEYRWRIPKNSRDFMRVPAVVYATQQLLEKAAHDKALEQVVNVASLPGIVKASIAMPDIHWGYGFCIGGVCATDIDNGGVISPGGVGYDINCGVRLLASSFTSDDIKHDIRRVLIALFTGVPVGIGKGGSLHLSKAEENKVMVKGAAWIVNKGYGIVSDLEHTEAGGALNGANPSCVSDRARKRGSGQCGSLGAGNHFIEIQEVTEIYDTRIASTFGIFKDQITVMIHTGSRGFGHQVCDDAIFRILKAMPQYGIKVPDRQLACVPVDSKEGRWYLAGMAAAANYAWANRQMLTHLVREVFVSLYDKQGDLRLVYDVAHNIAKIEKHVIDGKQKRLCVHRKGATRAFGPGHPELPECYRAYGQPVIVPGDMGTCSYLLVGTGQAMEESFGSTCHGAGRAMSRKQAIRTAGSRSIEKELEEKGVLAMAGSRYGLVEERPEAYKDVSEVVDVVEGAGISKKIAKLRPLGVIKG